MESLLPANDLPGLNIVCTVDAGGNNGTNRTHTGGGVGKNMNIHQKMKKPKKKNKYEKRRAQARKAKQLKENSGTDKEAVSKEDGKEKEKGKILSVEKDKRQGDNDNDNDSNGPSDEVIQKTETKITHTSNESNENKHDGDVEDNEKTENDKMELSESTSNRTATKSEIEIMKEVSNSVPETYNVPVITNTTTTQPIINMDNAASRKNQQLQTEQLLKDEVKRAEYMSTYHARPFEMDRKSGAVSKIQQSRSSSHIFGNDGDITDDESTSNSNGDGGSSSKNGCPFTSCGLHPNIVRVITSSKGSGLNLERPTMIQRHAWEQILIKKESKKDNNKSIRRRNLFVQSETGSGKTLAYLLPIVQQLAIDSKTFKPKKVDRQIGGTRAIILCPTRELATQTAIVTEKVCTNSFPWLVAGCLSGGEKRKSEKARLRKGISILIATPGRLLDHLAKTDSLLMALKGKLEWVVLDESDRLLDLGLGSQVEQIIQMIRANQPKSGIKRDGITWQSLLVSATINDKVEKMASKLLGGDSWVWARASKSTQQKGKNNKKDDGTGTSTDPNTSNADSSLELSSATPKQLTQHHMVVSSKLRLAALISFLTTRIQMKERIVVFMSTCDGVDFHHKLLSHMQPIVPWEKGSEDLSEYKSKGGIFGSSCKLYRLHGNIPHKERHNIMSQFSDISKLNKEAAIMITTDVAARGLNLPSVNWIVQYDPPCETADYIHRAGRAARAGKAGHALLFLLPSELQYVEVLKIRGLSKLTALSLSSTLQAAAKICPDVTEEGLEKSGLTRANTNRIGEAFSSAVQLRLEDCILNNNKAYKESLSKKALPHGSDKEQKRRQKREAKNAIGPLLESARLAFSAYIRGYSAKEKCVKHIFSARALHLGHVAKSFALREQPKELSKAHRERRQANKGDGDELKSTGRKRSSQLAFGQKRNDKRNRKEDTDADEAPDTGAYTQHNMPKSSRAISFLEASSSNDTGHKRGRGKNIKANMLAAASRMEEGDMEFF